MEHNHDHKKNYIIVKDRHPRISEVLNDCISLCVPTSKNEPLSSILQKICIKLTNLQFQINERATYSLADGEGTTVVGVGTQASPWMVNIVDVPPPTVFNGISITDENEVVLGQDLGDLDNPAALVSDREVPSNGFSVHLTGLGGIRIGDSVLNTIPDGGGNLASSAKLSLGGILPSLTFNIEDSCCVSGLPWGGGTIVWRSQSTSASDIHIDPAIFGNNVFGALQCLFGDPGNQAVAWNFWCKNYNEGSHTIPFAVLSAGSHFEGERPLATASALYCLHIGVGYNNFGIFNGSSTFKVDANNLPFQWANLPTHVIDSNTQPIIIDTTTNSVYRSGSGASGSFTAQSGETITVVNGFITAINP